MKGPRNLVLAVMFVIFAAGFSTAGDIYVAQNAAGGNTGADCADAHSAAWFNTSSNWGSNGGQIGPGTTVHLCGTFNAPAGASGYLTFQSSGTSGNPITLHFENGALMQAPYWGTKGAISSAGGLSYLVVDGGTNGTIQATLDGSPGATCLGGACQYQQNGFAVNLSPGNANCNNCEIKNLAISDMYMHTAGSNDPGGNNGIGLAGNNISIDNNTIHDTAWAINSGYTPSGTSNVQVFNNTIYNIDHGVALGDSASGSTISGLLIYGNDIHDFANWDTKSNTWHHDGIHVWAANGSSSGTPFMIYNNYIHGNFGSNANAGIYLEFRFAGDSMGVHYVFNNIFDATAGSCANGPLGEFTISGNNGYVYNNTAVGNCTGLVLGNTTTGNGALANDVYSAPSPGAGIADTTGGASLSSSDYNDWYNLNRNDSMNYGGWYASFSSYQSSTGFDPHSITSNPNLNSSYVPNAGSPVIQAGTNLHSICNGQPNPGLGALCSDYAGNPRPSSGNWDIGAYAYTSGGAPAPPTGLTAVIQ